MKKTLVVLGFSLIELMIVVTIIGILTSLALPSYLHYTKRARFSEVISAAEPYKIAIALALQQGSSLQDLANGQQGIPPEPAATVNLASLKVENGSILAQGTALSGNASYELKPNNDGTQWTVKGSCLKAGLCEKT